MNDSTEILALLRMMKCKLVLAESCTGGAIAAALTQIPGVSNYFCGSFVVYRLESKRSWLGISPALLKKERGVGQGTTRALALAALKKTPEAGCSVSVTGHLGPGAPHKLDGRIFGAIALRQKRKVEFFPFEMLLPAGSRKARQRIASLSILKMVRSLLTREAHKGEVRNANAIKYTKGRKQR